MSKELLKMSFLLALGEGIYIVLVAVLMRNTNEIFGNTPSVLGIVSVLLLLVLSAAISGALIFGKSILLYLEGKKKDAVILFFMVLGWMLLFLASIILFAN